jgi:quercetin dioxygenase-like cupin family protein
MLVVLTAAATLEATAGASPGSGAVGELLARGTSAESLKVKGDEQSEVIFQRVTLAPGGFTGWHSHAGQLLVVVKSGTLTRYTADCSFETYRAGQSFIETDDVHQGRNLGSDPVELYVVYVNPQGAPLRFEEAERSCPI